MKITLPRYSVDVSLAASDAARLAAISALAEHVGDQPWHLRYTEQFNVEMARMVGTYVAGVDVPLTIRESA